MLVKERLKFVTLMVKYVMDGFHEESNVIGNELIVKQVDEDDEDDAYISPPLAMASLQ